MKIISFTICSLLLCLSALGQSYEPSILILAPGLSEFDRKLEKEVNGINAELNSGLQDAAKEQYLSSDEFKSLPEHIKLMTASEIAFSKDSDFFKKTSAISQQYLAYRFYERFPNLLILLTNQTSKGKQMELKILADSAKTQYVLNFPKISVYRKGGIHYAKVAVQLFDRDAEEYLIESEFNGDWNNPGFEFACRQGSLHCTINNALSQALAQVIEAVVNNSPTILRERQLAQERYEELVTNHLPKRFDTELIKEVVDGVEDIQTEDIFQVLLDGSGTKFVAFSLKQVPSQDFKSLTDDRKDRNVKIISSKSIKDKDFLQSVPQMYAFIIKAVKFEGEWYYEKANVTYFEAETIQKGRAQYFNNLQEWNFFMENSTMVSPGFWETGLFEKVPDLKQHPDWEKYGDGIWETREVRNRGYIGMYEIVANILRQRNSEENKSFQVTITERILKPAYEKLKKKYPDAWSAYSEHSPIHSQARDVVIHPVLLTDRKGIKTVHYFVAFPGKNDVFEWTYFPPEQVNAGVNFFGSTVVEQMESITRWNFGYDTLDDDAFWGKYVLAREGDQFRYLKKVEL